MKHRKKKHTMSVLHHILHPSPQTHFLFHENSRTYYIIQNTYVVKTYNNAHGPQCATPILRTKHVILVTMSRGTGVCNANMSLTT